MTKYEEHVQFCKEQKLPVFCPVNGNCHCCGKNVFDRYSAEAYITGCPFCCRSFCD